MPVLMLREDDVRKVLTMEMAMEGVEIGLKKLGIEEAMNINRARVVTDHGVLHTMGASAKTLGGMGSKVYATTRKGNAQFLFTLFDGKTGDLLSLMQADYLGQVRTGAASGVATKYLANPDASRVGIFGSGKQARTQLIAMCKVRAITKVDVFSHNEEHRNAFAKEMTEVCGVEVTPLANPDDVAKDKDILVTATSARDPFFKAEWLKEGMHVNAIGSNFMGKAELTPEAVQKFSRIVVDSRDQCRIEAGDFQKGFEDGTLKWGEVRELGPIIGGRYKGRVDPSEITLFKSLGLGIEDLAVALKVFQKAKAEGLGQEIEW